MNNRVTVSVLMITYNHEKYISQAIDSALMQKTNFDYEIVIGEDCSTDKTREIVLEYKAKYPDKIKLILQEKNVGPAQNWIDTYRACIGKYIALLEGDDYWTDPYKLQKQVDILEAHPEYSMCFHNALVIDDENKSTYLFNDRDSLLTRKKMNNDREIEAWELLNEWICPTASVVFRNNYNLDYELFKKTKYSDIILFLSLARKGKVYYFNKPYSVYRKLLTGQRKVYSNNIIGLINHYKLIDDHFSDLPNIKYVCTKFLIIHFYNYVLIEIRLNGLKYFIRNTKSLVEYFLRLLNLKSSNSKAITFYFIFYKITKATFKFLLNKF